MPAQHSRAHRTGDAVVVGQQCVYTTGQIQSSSLTGLKPCGTQYWFGIAQGRLRPPNVTLAHKQTRKRTRVTGSSHADILAPQPSFGTPREDAVTQATVHGHYHRPHLQLGSRRVEASPHRRRGRPTRDVESPACKFANEAMTRVSTRQQQQHKLDSTNPQTHRMVFHHASSGNTSPTH